MKEPPKIPVQTQQPSPSSRPTPSNSVSKSTSSQNKLQAIPAANLIQQEKQAPLPVVQKEEEPDELQYVQYANQVLYLRRKDGLENVLNHCRVDGS